MMSYMKRFTNTNVFSYVNHRGQFNSLGNRKRCSQI